jgi:hypothetical protein
VPTLIEVLAGDFPEQFELASTWASRLAEIETQQSLFEAAEAHPSVGPSRILGVGLTPVSWPGVRDRRVAPV